MGSASLKKQVQLTTLAQAIAESSEHMQRWAALLHKYQVQLTTLAQAIAES